MGQFFDLNDSEFCDAYVEEAFIADVQYEVSRKMKSAGVSRAELARRMGVSAPYITQLMGDAGGNLTLRTVARLFKALGERPIITHCPMQELATACASDVFADARIDLTEATIGLQWHEVQPYRLTEWEESESSPKEASSKGSEVSDGSNIVWIENYLRAAA